jgi:hypothetical protein
LLQTIYNDDLVDEDVITEWYGLTDLPKEQQAQRVKVRLCPIQTPLAGGKGGLEPLTCKEIHAFFFGENKCTSVAIDYIIYALVLLQMAGVYVFGAEACRNVASRR